MIVQINTPDEYYKSLEELKLNEEEKKNLIKAYIEEWLGHNYMTSILFQQWIEDLEEEEYRDYLAGNLKK